MHYFFQGGAQARLQREENEEENKQEETKDEETEEEEDGDVGEVEDEDKNEDNDGKKVEEEEEEKVDSSQTQVRFSELLALFFYSTGTELRLLENPYLQEALRMLGEGRGLVLPGRGQLDNQLLCDLYAKASELVTAENEQKQLQNDHGGQQQAIVSDDKRLKLDFLKRNHTLIGASLGVPLLPLPLPPSPSSPPASSSDTTTKTKKNSNSCDSSGSAAQSQPIAANVDFYSCV